MKFKGKTVWIIGSSSGIGKALSFDFARQQAKLVLSSRNIDALEEIKNRDEVGLVDKISEAFDMLGGDCMLVKEKDLIEQVKNKLNIS